MHWKGENVTLRIFAIFLIPFAVFAFGCQGEEKKTDTKVYEPPKLRSAADRGSGAKRPVSTDVRVSIKMTKDAVEKIQGKPDRVDVISYQGTREEIEDWRYLTLQNGCRLVQFTNGHVTMLRNCVGLSNIAPKEE